MACPVCGSGRLADVFHVAAAPVHQNLLAATESDARAYPRGDIALLQCLACGFVFNAAFDEARMSHAPGYVAGGVAPARLRELISPPVLVMNANDLG